MTTTTHYDETETNHLQAGTYSARCTAFAWDTTKTGDPCLACQFSLTSGKPGFVLDGRLYFDTEKEDTKGRTAADRSLEALNAMGFEGDLSALDALDADPDCITKGSVDLVVEINERGYPVVKFINAPRSARDLRVFNAPDQGTKQGFFAKMAARSKALAAKTNATGARPIGGASRATPAQSGAADRAADRAASQNARPVAAAKPAPSAAPPRGPGLGARTDERFRDECRDSSDDDIPFDGAPAIF